MVEKIIIFFLSGATKIIGFLTDLITKTPRILLFLIIMMFFSIVLIQRSEIRSLQTDIQNQSDELEQSEKELIKSNETVDLQRSVIQELRDSIDSFNNRSDKRISFEVKSLITKYSKEYSLDEPLVECIVSKESSGNPLATSPSGKYVGLAQYSLSTFYSHRRKLGLSEEDLRHDPDANLQAMTSALSRGESSHWPNTYKACIS